MVTLSRVRSLAKSLLVLSFHIHKEQAVWDSKGFLGQVGSKLLFTRFSWYMFLEV